MGRFNKEQTVTDSQFVDLLQPDLAYRQARRYSMFASKGDIAVYNKLFWQWKHGYKQRQLSKDKLVELGYYPLEPGTFAPHHLDLTSIVPLKIHGFPYAGSEEGAHNEDKILNSFNIGGKNGEELMDQLFTGPDAEKIDSAYLMEGMPLNSRHPSVIKALYQSFDYYQNGGFEFWSNYLQIVYGYTKEVFTVDGVLGPVDSYWSNGNGTVEDGQRWADAQEKGKVPRYPTKGGYYNEGQGLPGSYPDDENPEGDNGGVLYYYWQNTATTFIRIRISSFGMSINMSGAEFLGYANARESEVRLIIPGFVLNGLKFREWVCVHERSFELLLYAKQTVTVYWYQRPVFRFIISVVVYIIGAYLSPVTGGASLVLSEVIVNALFQAAVSMAISYALSYVASEYLGDYAFIMQIVQLVIQFMQYDFDFSQIPVENYLPLASAVFKASSSYVASTEIESAKQRAEVEAEAKRLENIEESYTIPYMPVAKADTSAHYSWMEINSPETFYRTMYGEGLYNYEQYFDVNKEIGIRTKVVPG